MNTMRDASKLHFNVFPDGSATLEQVNAGSLQRIADATEVMATNFLKLQQEAESQRKRGDRNWAEVLELQKALSIQKGLTTRYKNQLHGKTRNSNATKRST